MACHLQHVRATCCVLTSNGKELELANGTFLLAVALAFCPRHRATEPKAQLAAQLITHTRAVSMCNNSQNGESESTAK